MGPAESLEAIHAQLAGLPERLAAVLELAPPVPGVAAAPRSWAAAPALPSVRLPAGDPPLAAPAQDPLGLLARRAEALAPPPPLPSFREPPASFAQPPPLPAVRQGLADAPPPPLPAVRVPEGAGAGPVPPVGAPAAEGGREDAGLPRVLALLERIADAIEAQARGGDGPGGTAAGPYQSPRFMRATWEASRPPPDFDGTEGYPAASPSVNVSSVAGLRGAGGWGYGSRFAPPGGSADFLEPGRRFPG